MAATGRITPSENVTRAAFGAFAAAASADSGRFVGKSPASIIRATWPRDEVSPLLVQRGATTPASTGTSAWAGVLAEQATGAFFGALPASAASRLIAAGTILPLERRSSINIPRRNGLPATLPWIAEAAPIPVRQYAFNEATLGPAARFATITVLTAELANASGAEDILAQLLREDAALSLDAAVFSDVAATDDNPAGLLNGVTPLVAKAGGGLAAMQPDLAALAGAVAAGGGSGSVAFVAHPAQAAAVSIFAPDLRLPVWPSRALPEGTVVAVDPTAFVAGFGAIPSITSSEQATVHMEGATPLPIATGAQGSGVLATPTRSLWQTRSIAIRLVADVAFTMRADGLVQVVEDVTW